MVPLSTTLRGNPTTVVRWSNLGVSPTSTYTFDETGQVTSKTDACGNTACTDMAGANHKTTYSYTDSPSGGNVAGNSNAYLTQITDPFGHTAKFGFNYSTGELVSATDANGQTTTYTYADPLNRLTQTSLPDAGGTSIVYNDSGPSITTTVSAAPNPSVTTVSLLDGMGRPTQTQLVSDPSGTTFVDTVYDGEGLVFTRSNPHRATAAATDGTTTMYYDALGRQVKIAEPDGNVLRWCYNGVISLAPGAPCGARLGSVASGSWVDSSDEVGNRWQRTSDSLGRMTEVMEPSGLGTAPTMETDYAYDLLNNLNSVTQWGGSSGSAGARVRSFTYDSLSRLLTSTNPETGTICYGQLNAGNCVNGYDGNGNLQYKTDARGVVTNYSYDALNRLLSKTYTNDATGALASCYQYDTLGGGGANLIGRPTAEWTQKLANGASCPSTKPSATMTSRTLSAYDAMGRLSSETQCVGNSCTKSYPGAASSYTYDLAGNLTTYGNLLGTAQFTNAYDTAGRLSSVTDAWTGAAQVAPLYPASLFSSPSYAPFGALSGATYGTRLNLTRTYDSRLRVTGEIDKGNPGSGPAIPGKAVISIMGGVQAK